MTEPFSRRYCAAMNFDLHCQSRLSCYAGGQSEVDWIELMLIRFEQPRCYLHRLISAWSRTVVAPIERFLLHTVAAPAVDATEIEFKVDAHPSARMISHSAVGK